MIDLRILADDLTGALDSAAAFAGDVPVGLDRPDPDAFAKAPVAAVATGTRDIPAEALEAALAPSVAWLANAGIAFKKVDSLLRGNTFAEVACVARGGGFRHILFAPAFPKQGRVTLAGRQLLSVPGTAPAPVGPAPPAEAFPALGIPLGDPDSDGPGLAVSIPDVRSDDDLLRLARRSLSERTRRWLWCGSAGLAHALAATHGLAPRPANAESATATDGSLLVLSASRHPVLRRQWDILRSAVPDAVTVAGGEPRALESAVKAMAAGASCTLIDLAPAEALSPPDAAARLARQLEAIVHRAKPPAALVVVGGDTLLALCRATATRTLLSRAPSRIGWGSARLVGGPWSAVACHSRSGAFGDPEDLSTMVRRLAGRAATPEAAP